MKKTKKEEICECPVCLKRNQEEQEAENFNFAVLISLIPLLVFTLFGQIGLF